MIQVAAIEIWYRKEVPAQPKGTSNGAVYDRLSQSALVGVLHFTKASGDFRWAIRGRRLLHVAGGTYAR